MRGRLASGLRLLSSEPLASHHGIRGTFDLVVIGGGSGGLAAAREAAALGGRVALLDAVVPSPRGTTWGLGGTCVNVGCIPKKLMHQAAHFGDVLGADAAAFGWQLQAAGTPQHSWERLREAVAQYVASSNYGYRAALRKEGIVLLETFGRLAGQRADGKHVVRASGSSSELVTSSVLIATGTRPFIPDIPGAAGLGVTSDDLFSLPHAPGRVLVVGGGYIALECAGFLCGLGSPVTVANRTDTFLRGFDRDLADAAVRDLARRGVRLVTGASVARLDKAAASPTAVLAVVSEGGTGTPSLLGEFDTVLFATGRSATSSQSWLEDGAPALDSSDGRVVGGFSWSGRAAMPEASSAEGVFAVGDILHANPELTPVAIHQGVRVARTLAAEQSWSHRAGGNRPPAAASVTSAPFLGGASLLGMSLDGITSRVSTASSSDQGADPGVPTRQSSRRPWQLAVPRPITRESVATAVFTPCELATVGLSEAEAKTKHGDDGVEVIWSRYDTLERSMTLQASWTPEGAESLVKIVAESASPWQILGFHLAGPGSSEAIQGLALALAAGVSLPDLQDCVGVHPTASEEVVSASVTKASGRSPIKTSC